MFSSHKRTGQIKQQKQHVKTGALEKKHVGKSLIHKELYSCRLELLPSVISEIF